MMPDPLENWGVLVTRPAGRETALARLIENAGGRAVHLPTVKIESLPAPAANPLKTLQPGDWLIAVSPAAVDHARGLLPALGSGVRLAAVGPGTARALEAEGLNEVIAPAHGGTEALLQTLPARDLKNRRVLILKGEGGRKLLAQELASRGARVELLDLYRRVCPPRAPESALAALDAGHIRAISITSAQGLDNLLVLAGPARHEKLLNTPLVVPSERLVAHARAAGFRGPVVCAGATDGQMLEGLVSLGTQIN